MTPTSPYPRRFTLWLLALLLAVPAAPALPATTELPDLGEESEAVLSPLEEQRLGEDFMRQARAQLDILDDPELSEYLQTLGNRLTTAAKTGHPYYFFLIDNPTINAFAVPGGYIGVHTGLLLAARHETELAAVLAHETAHVTQRHIPRMIAESRRMSGPTMAAILAGILLAAAGGGQGGEAAIALATAGAAQHQINFTRTFEQEADRIGMQVLDGAGYDARAMPAFFERMETLSRLYETNVPEFLLTHPVTGRRIAESQDQAERFPQRPAGDDFEFRHMQARLQALGGKSGEAVLFFRGQLENGGAAQQGARRYGLALALLASRKPAEAEREIASLIAGHPDYPPYYSLRAEAELAAGRTGEGLETFRLAVARFPGSLALTQRYGEALLNRGQPRAARNLLDRAVRQHPSEPALYRLLARAAGNAGYPMEAHRAYGEYYFLTGQPRAAIEQLDLALKHTRNDFYYVASIEARIKEIRERSGLLQGPAPRSDPAPKK